MEGYLNAGFTKKQAEFLVKRDKEHSIEIKTLRGQLIKLEAVIFHRQNLMHITPTNGAGRLTSKGKERVNNLRKQSPWKNMTERQIRSEKNRLSKTLHGLPPSEYRSRRQEIETKMKHYNRYSRGNNKTSPNFILSPRTVRSNFPKKYVTARKTAKHYGLV